LIMRLLQAILFGVGLAFPCVVVAQTAPTATEEFNLRIKCKQMADEKADVMKKELEQKMANVITWHASNYDPKSNRCYVEIKWKAKDHLDTEVSVRQVYDAQTDDLLSHAQVVDGKKLGGVYAPDYKADIPLGFDNANAYMDDKMYAHR
jgi:hypothetical protein